VIIRLLGQTHRSSNLKGTSVSGGKKVKIVLLIFIQIDENVQKFYYNLKYVNRP